MKKKLLNSIIALFWILLIPSVLIKILHWSFGIFSGNSMIIICFTSITLLSSVKFVITKNKSFLDLSLWLFSIIFSVRGALIIAKIDLISKPFWDSLVTLSAIALIVAYSKTKISKNPDIIKLPNVIYLVAASSIVIGAIGQIINMPYSLVLLTVGIIAAGLYLFLKD